MSGDPGAERWQVRFYTIWAGQACSLLGSELVQFALIWWLTETTGSGVTLATATIAGRLPTILLGPLAGALVDRWSRKWVLVLSDGLIALLTALLGLLFWLDVAQTWHVYVILFLRSLSGCFQNPAMIATTTALVPQDQLTRVGGVRSTFQGALQFGAPPLGALLLALIGVQGVLPLDLITAALAIVPLLLLRVPEVCSTPEAKPVRASVLAEFRQGLAYVWQRRGLAYLLGTAALWSLAAAPALAFMPLYVTEHLGGGPFELGWVQSGWGMGMIAGGAIVSAWGGFERDMATSITGTSIAVAGMAIIALAPESAWWVAAAGMSVIGIGVAPHSSGLRAAQQSVVEPAMQGRYFALQQSLMGGLSPLSLAIAGPIADRHGVQVLWYGAVASGLLIASLRRFVPSIYHLGDAVAVRDA